MKGVEEVAFPISPETITEKSAKFLASKILFLAAFLTEAASNLNKPKHVQKGGHIIWKVL